MGVGDGEEISDELSEEVRISLEEKEEDELDTSGISIELGTVG